MHTVFDFDMTDTNTTTPTSSTSTVAGDAPAAAAAAVSGGEAEEKNAFSAVPMDADGSGEDQLAGNLIVNDIPQRISEAELKQMFEPFGTVEHVKLMLDRRTHASMGYGFVRFATAEEADRAIAALNGKPIDTKTLRVSHSRPPTSQDTNLYVGNLDISVTREALTQLFERYGKVIEAKILTDRTTGVGKGYGFVRFERREDCDAAIAALHNAILPSISTRGLAVRYHRSGNNNNNNFFGRNMGGGRAFAYSTSSSSVAASTATAPVYSMYPVASPYVSMMPMSLVSGVVIPQQNMGQRSGGNMGANKAQQSYNGVCVFVYNLPQDSEQSMLRRLFAPYGNVTHAKVMKSPDGRCRGFGFVNMSTMDEALRAISALNGFPIMGKNLQVSLKTDKQPPM